jgi:hypothetical protein
MLELSRFDRRGYPTVSVREGYREWLPSYETTVEDEMDLVRWIALKPRWAEHRHHPVSFATVWRRERSPRAYS